MDQKAQERSDATALIQGPNLPSEAGKQRQHGAVSLAGPEHCEHEVSDGLPEDVDGMHVCLYAPISSTLPCLPQLHTDNNVLCRLAIQELRHMYNPPQAGL